MKKVTTIVGARPQFVKAALVSKKMLAAGGFAETIVHTGQHYDFKMSDVFFDELGIPAPKHHLGAGSGSHGAQTGRMLEGIEKVLLEARPDWVLVYGDTNSTLAGALAAAKLKIPIAHVEAGLRSFDRHMPEEINRITTDHLSDLLFAPTTTAVYNLSREGLAHEKIRMTGDVMYDAALAFGQGNSTPPDVGNGYVLATIHRAENTDDPVRLRTIVEGLRLVAKKRPVVLPIHPRTVGALKSAGLTIGQGDGVRLMEPVGYIDMLRLEKHAAVIATDSGGVQKEAFFFKVPCVTLRNGTEWVELVETGWNRLCKLTSGEHVAAEILAAADRPGLDLPLYGNGNAAELMVGWLARATPG